MEGACVLPPGAACSKTAVMGAAAKEAERRGVLDIERGEGGPPGEPTSLGARPFKHDHPLSPSSEPLLQMQQ